MREPVFYFRILNRFDLADIALVMEVPAKLFRDIFKLIRAVRFLGIDSQISRSRKAALYSDHLCSSLFLNSSFNFWYSAAIPMER